MGNPLIYSRKENAFVGNYLSGITLNGEYMNKHRTVLVGRAGVCHKHTPSIAGHTEWRTNRLDQRTSYKLEIA